MTQQKFLSNLLAENQDVVIIGSLGTISYDLTDIPHPNKILIRGAMGAVIGVGVGHAMARPDKKVIVCIGDGSFLMKAGSIATVSSLDLPNLHIKILCNKKHQSTGGQPNNIDFFPQMVGFSNVELVRVE